MTWVIGAIVYVGAVTSIVRFFQFVSDTDRTINGFWASQRGLARVPSKIRGLRRFAMKGSRRRNHSLRTGTPQHA